MWPITTICPEAMQDSPVLYNEKARLTTSFFLSEKHYRPVTDFKPSVRAFVL